MKRLFKGEAYCLTGFGTNQNFAPFRVLFSRLFAFSSPSFSCLLCISCSKIVV
ncbi:MAG: hypothetical protein LBK06_03825 [Planctomycetaceae bacterium]|nr:hypothetical protein [Planctomycetaceae bacterium]